MAIRIYENIRQQLDQLTRINHQEGTMALLEQRPTERRGKGRPKKRQRNEVKKDLQILLKKLKPSMSCDEEERKELFIENLAAQANQIQCIEEKTVPTLNNAQQHK